MQILDLITSNKPGALILGIYSQAKIADPINTTVSQLAHLKPPTENEGIKRQNK